MKKCVVEFRIGSAARLLHIELTDTQSLQNIRFYVPKPVVSCILSLGHAILRQFQVYQQISPFPSLTSLDDCEEASFALLDACPYFTSNLLFISNEGTPTCCRYCYENNFNQDLVIKSFRCKSCGNSLDKLPDDLICVSCNNVLCAHFCEVCQFSTNYKQRLSHCKSCGNCHSSRQNCAGDRSCAYCYSSGDGMFNQLVTLSCSHTLCEKCVETYQRQNKMPVSSELQSKIKCYCRPEPVTIVQNDNLKFQTVEMLQGLLVAKTLLGYSGEPASFCCKVCLNKFSQLNNCNGQYCGNCDVIYPKNMIDTLQFDEIIRCDQLFYNIKQDQRIAQEVLTRYENVFAKAKQMRPELTEVQLVRLYLGDYAKMFVVLNYVLNFDQEQQLSINEVQQMVEWMCMNLF